MVLLDILGRRAALRVLWELSTIEAPVTFRNLQAAADTNPAVLNARLKELRQARLVEHDVGGYRLTAEGRSLLVVFLPLHKWAAVWATGISPSRNAKD